MNSDKCHLTLSSNHENKKIENSDEVINKSQVQKLFAVHIDYELKFDTHIETLCEKVGRKASCPFSSYKVHFYKSSTIINEKLYNVSIQLLSTNLDVIVEGLIFK